jgi:AcrR family transcriptional regulator
MAGRKTETRGIRRRMSAAQRRQVILDCAIQRFARQGYLGTTMDEIAAASGVSKPVLYDHFASKLDLYGALMAMLRDALMRAAAELAASDARRDGRARFAASAEIFFRFAQKSPDALRVLVIPPEGDAKAIFQAVQDGATAQIAALIDGAAPAGRGQSTPRAILLKAGMHALALWAAGQSRQDPAKLAALVADTYWSGIGARAH